MISSNTRIGSTVSMIILNSNSTSKNEDSGSLVTFLRYDYDVHFHLLLDATVHQRISTMNAHGELVKLLSDATVHHRISTMNAHGELVKLLSDATVHHRISTMNAHGELVKLLSDATVHHRISTMNAHGELVKFRRGE